MKTMNFWMVIFTIVLITGCAPPSRYVWENYDQKLYDHYKNPAEYDLFVEGLKNTIGKGDESGKVPPGIYAEYGFALYEKGKIQESIIYFQKEHDKWPESRVLMSKMSITAQKQTNKNNKATSIKESPVQSKEVSQ